MKKQKNKTNLKKYLGEGLLIVFSVLFALFINKTYEDVRTNSYKNNALEQIKMELIGNQEVLREWMEGHGVILENLNNLIENKKDSVQRVVESQGYLPMRMILNNKSIVKRPLLNSAWTSAQSIGITSEFDFKTLQYIHTTYELQELIMGTSIVIIAERIYLKSSDLENVNGFLIELKSRFENLRGQEKSLEYLYGETIKMLQ